MLVESSRSLAPRWSWTSIAAASWRRRPRVVPVDPLSRHRSSGASAAHLTTPLAMVQRRWAAAQACSRAPMQVCNGLFWEQAATGRCVPYGEETTVLSCEASHLQGLAAVLPFVMRLPLVCCGSHLILPWSAWSRMSILQSLHKWMRTAKITGVS